MKLKNTTDLPDNFVRAMIRWCAKIADVRLSDIGELVINKRYGRSFASYSKNVRVSVAPRGYDWPYTTTEFKRGTYRGCPTFEICSYFEELIRCIVHELRHIHQYVEAEQRSYLWWKSELKTQRNQREIECESYAMEGVSEFRQWWHELLYQWWYS